MRELFREYIKIFKNSNFIHSVFVLVSGTFIGQFIILVTIPIVSRLYSAKAYGEFAVYSSTAQIIIGIGALGLSSAILAPKMLERSKEVFYTALVIELAVFSFFLIVALLVAPFFHFFSISIPYFQAIILCYVYMVFSGFSALLSTYVNRLKMNRVLFWNSVIAALSTLFITIPLGYLGAGSLGFIIAGICGYMIANLQMLYRVNPFQRFLSFKEMASVCKEFKDYIIFQFPSNWIDTFTVQLPNFLFSAYYGNAALGGYAMSERVLGYPIRLVASPVGTIYFRHATQYIQDGKIKELADFTYSFITKILLIAFIPMVLFMIFSVQLFRFVLGNNWEAAGLIASILAIQYVFKFCEQCITYCLVVLGKQKINFVVSVIKLAIIGVSIGIGIIFFHNILATIVCFAIGSTIVQILMISVDFYYLGIRISEFFLPLFLFAASAVSLIVIIRFFQSHIS